MISLARAGSAPSAIAEPRGPGRLPARGAARRGAAAAAPHESCAVGAPRQAATAMSRAAARAGMYMSVGAQKRNWTKTLLPVQSIIGSLLLSHAIFASQRPRRNRRRRATCSRRPDCPGRECVPPRRGYSGTVPTGRGSRDDSRESTAGIRGVGLAFKKSGMAPPATSSLTRAHHRSCGGRAAAARLPSS